MDLSEPPHAPAPDRGPTSSTGSALDPLLKHPKLALSAATRKRLQDGRRICSSAGGDGTESELHLLFELRSLPEQGDAWCALFRAFPVQRLDFPGGVTICRIPWNPALLPGLLALDEVGTVSEETVRRLAPPSRP